MKRKVISMILCAMMAVSMIGCGSSDDKANDSTPPAETGGTETSGSETGGSESSGGGALEAFTAADGAAVAPNAILQAGGRYV